MLSPRPPTRRRPGRRRAAAVPAVVLLVLACWAPAAGAQARQAGPSTSAPVELPPPKASIVVDVGSGAVYQRHDARTPVRVASLFKVFTALVVHREVRPDDLVPISARARSMPALRISAETGQRWRADGLLHAMLIASANDAAVALAERAGGGTTSGYQRAFAAEARRLGLRDHPTLRDPAGLDDESSVGGGNLISAADLAIAARELLRTPALAEIVGLPEHRFRGGDGRDHRVVNHNRFLKLYDGAIGMKTGYTERSGYSLLAAARRDGHTLIAVVVDSPSTYAQAAQLLDDGFAAIAAGQSPLAHLPDPEAGPRVATARDATSARAAGRPRVAASSAGRGPSARPDAAGSGSGSSAPVLVLLLVAGVAVALLFRRGLLAVVAGPPAPSPRQPADPWAGWDDDLDPVGAPRASTPRSSPPGRRPRRAVGARRPVGRAADPGPGAAGRRSGSPPAAGRPPAGRPTRPRSAPRDR